jgi:hypothetical protein
MFRRLVCLSVLVFLLPSLLLAQQGKLRGRVTDKQTGEPLIGANVILEGTSLGAATDVNGYYVVLGIPPGTYTVKVTYIGYQPVSVSNIRISANLTTTQDFQLAPSAIQVEALRVVAERPLIQRNTTNTIRMTTQEDIENLPFRGVQNIIALHAGTVMQDGVLHVRGGRAGEIAYFVDGATATNPLYNSQNIPVIQEAIEEIQLQAGGYTAEFGGANSAVVRTILRTGGPKYTASIDYRTDNFAEPGKKFLGTYSYGYENAVITVGGPVPFLKKMRFFIAGQYNYMKDRNPTFIVPFEFDSLTDDGFEGRQIGEPLPGPIVYKSNHLWKNWRGDRQIQGTLVYEATKSLKFKLTGTYRYYRAPTQGGNFMSNLYNYFNLDRRPIQKLKTTLLNLRVTHLLNPNTYYELNFSYSNRSSKTVDPIFGDDWMKYPDSLANLQAGVFNPEDSVSMRQSGWQTRYLGPPLYSTINNFEMEAPGTPPDSYNKNSQTDYGIAFNLTSQITKQWELKIGGRYDYWTMRLFNVGSIRRALEFQYGPHGTTPQTFESDYERKVRVSKAGFITFYGYDVDGNKLDKGPDGPRHPIFASFYVQNKLEYRDLIVNFGLRFEHIDLNAPRPKDIENPAMDTKLDYVKEDELTYTKPYQYLLPRITFSFPVTDRTVFYALYGKYVQMPRLADVYRGIRILSWVVSPVTRRPYGYFGQYAGFTAKPEFTIQYELGIRQSITDNFAFTLTGFYKDLRDQLRIDREYTPDGQVLFSAWKNFDFGTVKGIELTLDLRRTKRLSARVNYTLSDARGTGSDSRSSRVVVSDATIARYPTFIYKLDYNQPHRGSVILDYRFAKGDGGKWLEGLGANLIFSFSSGHAYTKIEEPYNLGQADPWDVGVRALRDVRNRIPEEPLNSSSTPWTFNLDMTLNKVFYFNQFNVNFYVNVLNVFNTKNVINVYPMTGTAEDDGWLRSPLAAPFYQIPNYVEFYRAINLQNRWGYQLATGTDIYGPPRQIRFGVKIEFK